MKAVVLFSGGKDSTHALHEAVRQGHVVKCLLTMLPKSDESWMFHVPNLHLTDMAAEALGIPLMKCATSGKKEEELAPLRDALAEIKSKGIEAVVSGAVASRYQYERISKMCAALGMESITPMWQRDPLAVLKEESAAMKIMIVGCYAGGFDESWLGRIIDDKCVRDIMELNRKYRISTVGEGGEFETLVLNAPLFKKEIEIKKSEKIWDEMMQSGQLHVTEARLVEK